MTEPSRLYDAVLCDIDGCLGPESAAPFDAEALAAVARHNRDAQSRRDRPVVTLCSGRPQPFAEAICRFIANTTLPVVCENGVWIYDPRDQRFLLDPAITPDHLKMVREATRLIEAHWLPRGVVIQPGKAASISLWHPDTAFLRSVADQLAGSFAREGWSFRVSMTVAWINCDLAHISKGTGLDRVMAMTGLRRERLAGIGDSYSDLPIAERVAFFACPANADPRLATHAAYISERHEVEGVLDILTRLTPER